MALTYNIETLRSRTQNKLITARRAAGKLLSGIIPKLKKFAGWAWTALTSFFNLSFTTLWDMFVSAYFALKYFDFNATDKALEAQIEANNKRLVVLAAEALGETLGFQTVRLANMFLGRFSINKARSTAATQKIPILTAEIGLALAEEGNEEIQENVKRFLRSTVSSQISNAFINTVLTARRNHWFGLNSITTAQTNGSIAQKIENKIEQLPKFWQEPVEEFIEGFEEGIIEAGYIVTMKIDDHVAAQRYAARNNGVKRIVEVTLEEGSDEKLKLTGTQDDVTDTLNTTLLGTFPLVKNRDIGQVFAEPVNETVKPKVQLRKVEFTFNEHPKPPYYRNKKAGVRASISVPDAKAGLKYGDLKGALDGYNRGNVFVSCTMDSGRQMAVYAVSEAEGQKVLRRLAALSTSNLVEATFRSSQADSIEKKVGTKRMYLQSASLLYPRRKNGKNYGATGDSVKVSLWQGAPPEDFKPFV